MDRLKEILHELGISKVKLARCLGVSRQMIYNYLDLDDVSKWPKDKKVLLFNLLGVKSATDIKKVKVDTDYIMEVETRMANLFEHSEKNEVITSGNILYDGLGSKQRTLMADIDSLMKEALEDDEENLVTYTNLYHFMQTMETSNELKYVLEYMAKASGFMDPLKFSYNEEEQFIYESILFTAMKLYHGGGISKTKLAEKHKNFVNQIRYKKEEKLSRTIELNTLRLRALKELGYTKITNENSSEVFAKITEIEYRSVS